MQALGAIAVLAMLYIVFYSYRRKEFSRSDLLVWVAILCWFLFAVIFHEFLNVFIAPLQVMSVFDLLLVTATGISLVMLLVLNKRLAKIESKVDLLVRKNALEQVK
ncbi:hypothetical protein AUJ65_02200 [Candidatus Micrarchaeota archaeon CG1_02_51_15]|nr:MAG: hypothetical protein AUJ65_02200 [Candidatus Micrarchaeota archaeon CG1_02_51_15]